MFSGNDGWPDGLSDCSQSCTGKYCNSCIGTPYSPAHDPNTCGYTVFDESGNWFSGMEVVRYVTAKTNTNASI